MAERLTKKQSEFLVECNCRMQNGYTADFKRNMISIPFHFGPLKWDDWGMRSRSDAEAFAQRLIDRGLIRADKQWFYWITDAGKAALAAGVSVPDGAGVPASAGESQPKADDVGAGIGHE